MNQIDPPPASSEHPSPPVPDAGLYRPLPPPVIPSRASDTIDRSVIEGFSKTRPWVRFLAILGYCSIAFMIVMALFMVGASLVADSAEFSPIEGVSLGFIYILMAFVYFIPTVLLWKYGTAIKKLTDVASAENLSAAVDSQRAFWKTVGIFAIIWILLSLAAMGVFLLVLAFTLAGGM